MLTQKRVKRSCAADGPVMNLKVLNYSEFGLNKNGFFISNDPRIILQKINEENKDADATFDIDDQASKLIFNVKANNTVAQINNPMFIKMTKIQVQIWQTTETDQYFVEFKRMGGSSFLFYDTVAKYTEMFSATTNTITF